MLHAVTPGRRVVVLTGFGNIATAVAAVKYGAIDYIPKPADADDILAALLAPPGSQAQAAGKPDVGRSRALGTYPARLRTLRSQRVGDGAPPEHAPSHAAANSRQAQSAVGFPASGGARDLQSDKDARARFAGKGVYPVEYAHWLLNPLRRLFFLRAGWCAAST